VLYAKIAPLSGFSLAHKDDMRCLRAKRGEPTNRTETPELNASSMYRSMAVTPETCWRVTGA